MKFKDMCLEEIFRLLKLESIQFRLRLSDKEILKQAKKMLKEMKEEKGLK